MKKLILLTISLLFTLTSFSQNDTTAVQRSTNKVRIGGETYYVHIVKKGETLFSISQAYEISQKEIATENPEIFLGLQIGQALKIPVVKEEEQEEIKDKKSFIYHRVKKGQTLYYLSKKYNVSQEDIIVCNPTVRYGINVDQIVKIPKSEQVVENLQKIPVSEAMQDTVKLSNDFIYHTVKSKETIYSLVREYDISEDILYEYNPSAKEGLKIDQVLKIPKIVSADIETVLVKQDTTQIDSLVFRRKTSVAFSDTIELEDCQKILPYSKRFNVAIMLPFYLDKNDEEFYIDSTEFDDKGERIYERVYYDRYYIYPRSKRFVEFYEGILLSIDSLKQTGLSVNVNVYDTANDSAKVQEILLDPELQNMDLIIGPIYEHEIKMVSEFSKQHGIHMVSPFSDNLNYTYDNEYMFQVYPSYEAQIEEFAKYTSTFQDKNLIIVHNGDSLSYGNIQMVKERIFSYLSIDTIVNNILFKEVVFTDSINALQHALDKEIGNVFVIPSNNEAFVADVVTKLNTLKTFGANVQVIGLSRWQRFSNIDPEYFFNLDLAIATPFFIDYDHADVKSYVLKYRDKYKTEPSQMAIHGYDIGLFFFSYLKDYGNNFSNCITNYKINLLQADYNFVKWYNTSGYENIGVDIVKYYQGYNIWRINDFDESLLQIEEEKEE